MVMRMQIELKTDTLLGALQKHVREEEYPGRAGLSWQQTDALSPGSIVGRVWWSGLLLLKAPVWIQALSSAVSVMLLYLA